MKYSLFVTGTDTDVGKTVVTSLLARFFKEKGCSAVTQKWIQTGSSGCYSEDLLSHIRFSDPLGFGAASDHTCRKRSPYVLKLAASPHLAARSEKVSIDKEKIKGAYRALSQEFDIVVVEGAGGVLVPFNDTETIADIAAELSLPVLIVANNRLGAINHTLLSIESLRARNMEVFGVLFNRVHPGGDNVILEDNIETIGRMSRVPVLGELRNTGDMDKLYGDFLPIAEKILRRITGRGLFLS